jgi:hypothetical protein
MSVLEVGNSLPANVVASGTRKTPLQREDAGAYGLATGFVTGKPRPDDLSR